MKNTLVAKVIKKIMLIILALAVVAMSIGCAKRQYTLEEQKTLVLEGLKEKYGQEFVGLSAWPSEPLKSNDEFYLYPKGGDPKTDAFSVIAGGSYGHFWFEDNYYGIFIKDEYEKTVRELLDKEFKEYKMELEMVNNTTVSSVLDKNTTLDQIYDKTLADYMAHKPKNASLMVLFDPVIRVGIPLSHVEGVDVEAATKRFMEAMAAKKLVCRSYVMVFDDEYYKNVFPERWKEWYRRYITGIHAEDLSVLDIKTMTRE